MSICKDCQRVFLRDEASCHGDNLRPIRSFFEKTLDCPLCATFHSDLLRKAYRGSDLNGHLDVKTYVNLDVSTLGITMHPRRDPWSSHVPDYLDYRSFTDEEGPLSAIISGRLVHGDGTSEAALDRITNFVNKHVAMETKGVLPLLPTRVVDVDSGLIHDHRVRLALGNGRRARYATLSHCWGTSANFVTTLGNQPTRVAGMDTGDMPKTFRDAITVARRLGLRYLWIDSLCILQGDKEDWEAESAKMGSYYGDSYITIAADCSPDDTNGFLRMRPSSIVDPPVADVVYADEVSKFEWEAGGQMCRLYLRKMSQHVNYGSDSNPIEREPLQQRAWTLQERYLSKHILHFGSNQNYLEDHTRKLIIFEDGRQTENNKLYWSQLYDQSDAIPFRGWYRMIEEYMMRDITDRSDTFPALSGIAQLIGRVSNETYRAGLWQGDIVRGLLWYIERGGNRSARIWKYQSQDYLAPSWSWVSAAGLVSFRLDYDERVSALGAETMIDRIEHTYSFITVVDCSTIPAGNDPLGRLERASLSLNAPIFPVQDLEWEDTPWKGPLVTISVDTRAGLYWSSATLDNVLELDSALRERSLYAVFIAYKAGGYHGPSSRWPHVSYGLIVERDSGEREDVFRRLGMFFRTIPYLSQEVPDGVISDAMFGETDRKTIILV